MREDVRRRVEEAVGRSVVSARPLSGGCVAEVHRADLAGGEAVVVKVGHGEGAREGRGAGSAHLDREGFMLAYLAERSRVPLPRVLHADPDLLVMTWVESGAPIDEAAEVDAAEILAALHEIRPEDGRGRFGLHRDTLIGPLEQPNAWCESWAEFFRDRRLLFMSEEAARAGRLSTSVHRRIEALAARIEEFVHEPATASLIHGDVWSGNVLCARGEDGRSQIAALIDPSIYYADAEMELAFITLFSTFGESFFARYRALRGIDDGFWRTRRDVYNLYPLLVHVRLFGGGYEAQVEGIVRRLGF